MPQQGPQPRIQCVRRGPFIPVGKVKPVAVVRHVKRMRDEANPKLFGKVIPVPGIVVADQIRNGSSPIYPPGKDGLEAHKSLRDQVPILDVSVEYIPDEIEMLHCFRVGLKTVKQGGFLGSLGGGPVTAKMHVGNKENHKTGRPMDGEGFTSRLRKQVYVP